MTARLEVHDASSVEAALCYLVSHGKSGGVGGFLSQLPFALNRGDRGDTFIGRLRLYADQVVFFFF